MREGAHGLQTFAIFIDLTGSLAIGHIPVLAGGDGQAGDGEIWIYEKSCGI